MIQFFKKARRKSTWQKTHISGSEKGGTSSENLADTDEMMIDLPSYMICCQ
jgi:hypothetical protein